MADGRGRDPPLTMSAADFEAWKALERRTPLEIEREGISL
jgi:hypothetical protein